MTNKNDIVFADGSVIKAGCLEYHGSHYLACGDVVCEFTETVKKEDEGGSFLLTEFVRQSLLG